MYEYIDLTVKAYKEYFKISFFGWGRFLKKASSHNDYYMINMGSKMLKIGSIWALPGPYLQR